MPDGSDAHTKQQVLDAVTGALALDRVAVGVGSSIPKRFFTEVISRLQLDVDESYSMPTLGKAIVESAGLAWGPECDSLDTPSGGGSTVTLEGLRRVREAVGVHLGFSETVAPEVSDAYLVVSEVAGKRYGGRYRQSATERRSIELQAMRLAQAHFESDGWDVDDVSGFRSYDLHCTRGSETLYVEVKGTTSHGDEVLLTAGEVALAGEVHPEGVLVVVSDIQLDEGGIAGSGTLNFYPEWLPAPEDLRPVGYRYSIPKRD